MPKVTIYHNPKCSKSRQTLALIEAQGIKPTIVEYLKQPPSTVELKSILAKLKLSAHELIRKKEAVYSELNLNKDMSDSALIKAMVENPILIERPIVVSGSKARLGRPPEQVMEIL